MAADAVFSNTDDASMIALLRRLRAGAAEFTFVHSADVYSAAPEDLVADLKPAPGTGLADGGYSSMWFFYCPKRFKNAQGKPSGHRHRAIAGDDKTCWHSETRPKDGATICNLSYGRKEEGSGRSFSRMGWCMTEYDDSNRGGDHVLCKIYRSSSSLAKRKSSKATTQGLSGSKRKAAVDHAQHTLPGTKMSHCTSTDQELSYLGHPLVQQQQTLISGHHQQMTMPECVDYQTLFPAEEEHFLVQQNTLLVTQQPDQQHNIESLFTAQGESDWEQIFQFLSDDNTMFTNDELLRRQGEDLIKEYELISGCSCTPTANIAPLDAGFSEALAV
ncbi:unnamed protein product [Urochloa humidicola]